ncbi:hypothetical protein PI125_g17109 [Phytophthora idaei]|nr:hypothetical protein PI125_g17109 [Phytophthora idaei]KAG3140413.1 hypothetical protein PI126_g16022 [Phytophthora idaei]
MDDGVDAGAHEEEKKEGVQPNLCFDFEGDEDFYYSSPVDGRVTTSICSTDSLHHDTLHRLVGETITDTTTLQTADKGGDLVDLLESAAFREGLEVFANTPMPSLTTGRPVQRQLRFDGLYTPRGPNSATGAELPITATTDAASTASSVEKPVAHSTRDQEEARRYLKLSNYSNRLRGGNLADFSDTVQRKRAAEDADELFKASYAKGKCAKATKAATPLKKRLGDQKTRPATWGGAITSR